MFHAMNGLVTVNDRLAPNVRTTGSCSDPLASDVRNRPRRSAIFDVAFYGCPPRPGALLKEREGFSHFSLSRS